MNDLPTLPPDELRTLLESLGARVRRLTIIVAFMVLAVMLMAGAVFGYMVNYFGRDLLLVGGISVFSAGIGFGVGWFTGRRV